MTDLPSTRIVRSASPTSEPLSLVVLGDDQLATYPLPPSGELSIGRSPKCDVPIVDKSISRRHAIVRVGDTITIEDLASANGTRVGGRTITPHVPTAIQHGELVELGEASIVIQRRAFRQVPRRIWTHGYFEGRVEDECTRATPGTTFAVVLVHCDTRPALDAIQATLRDVLAPIDVAGEYSAHEYEVLLVDKDPAAAEERARALVEALAGRSVSARAGVACFPRDGRSSEQLVAHAAGAARPRSAGPAASREVVIADPAMVQLRRVIERVAGGTLSVLLLGETGVGKEILAELVHASSPRAGKPFVRLNCAAMTETLLESELFGHEKGAFTGATATKLGLLETANGGTVFLDEIGEISPAIQVKLLRVLEDRKVMRVGALKPTPIDVRFVAATNRDLEQEVARGRFREDLYYRLAGISLAVPPLRERPAEVLPLARSFLVAAAHGGPPVQLDDAAAELLARYSWPGNIRELRNVIERAVLLGGGGKIRPEHLPVDKMRATYVPPREPAAHVDDDHEPEPPTTLALDALYRGESERERILSTLELCRGNQTKAARVLGMSRRTLIYRLEHYGLPRPRKGR